MQSNHKQNGKGLKALIKAVINMTVACQNHLFRQVCMQIQEIASLSMHSNRNRNMHVMNIYRTYRVLDLYLQ